MLRFLYLFLFLFLYNSSQAHFQNESNYKTGLANLSSKESLAIFAIGSSLTLVSFSIDPAVNEYFSNHSPHERFFRFGNSILGRGYLGGALGIFSFSYGHAKHNPELIRFGIAQSESLISAFLATTAIKYTINRSRPVERKDLKTPSFPSGHTSTVFATATSLTRYCGVWTALPAYTLALYTGLGRIYSNSHFLSDVVFGATIGTVFGYAFSEPKKIGNSEHTLQIMPLIDSVHEFEIKIAFQ